MKTINDSYFGILELNPSSNEPRLEESNAFIFAPYLAFYSDGKGEEKYKKRIRKGIKSPRSKRRF